MSRYRILTFLFATYFLLGLILNGTLETWLGLAVLFFVMSLFILVRIFPRAFRDETGERLAALSFTAMGILSFLFVVGLGRDLAWIVFRLTSHPSAGGSPSEFFANRWVVLIALVAFAVGVAWASFGPRLRHVRISVPTLPEGLRGLRLVQISDLHIGVSIRRRYVERVVRLTNSVEADFVVFTGDIGDGEVARLSAEIEALKDLKAKSGIFYVTGNHEYYWNADHWIAAFRSVGMNVLLNETRTVSVGEHRVLIAGITDPAAPMAKGHEAPSIGSTLARAETADFKILLSHRPHFAQEAEAHGIDLQLSGHTHAGQFFPWTLVVKMVHEFAHGLHRLERMWIYVSAGTGSWGPRLRFGTTPELTVIELM